MLNIKRDLNTVHPRDMEFFISRGIEFRETQLVWYRKVIKFDGTPVEPGLEIWKKRINEPFIVQNFEQYETLPCPNFQEFMADMPKELNLPEGIKAFLRFEMDFEAKFVPGEKEYCGYYFDVMTNEPVSPYFQVLDDKTDEVMLSGLVDLLNWVVVGGVESKSQLDYGKLRESFNELKSSYEDIEQNNNLKQ